MILYIVCTANARKIKYWEKKMPILKGHERGTELVRFSANLRPETKELLEGYAHANRLTLAMALDALIRAGTKRAVLPSRTHGGLNEKSE
jgi:hypothetical protein